jgi:hypothetical protein
VTFLRVPTLRLFVKGYDLTSKELEIGRAVLSGTTQNIKMIIDFKF